MNKLEEQDLKFLDYDFSPKLGWISERIIEPIMNECNYIYLSYPCNTVLEPRKEKYSNFLNVHHIDYAATVIKRNNELSHKTYFFDDKIAFNTTISLSKNCYNGIINAKENSEIYLVVLKYTDIRDPWHKCKLYVYDKQNIMKYSTYNKNSNKYVFNFACAETFKRPLYGFYGQTEYAELNKRIEVLKEIEIKYNFLQEAYSYAQIKPSDKTMIEQDLYTYISKIKNLCPSLIV